MADFPAITNLVILQGSTFNQTLQALSSSGALVDWTGYTARMMAKASYNAGTSLISLTTENGGIVVNGTSVQLYMSATATDALTFDTAVYDIEMVIANYYGAGLDYVYRAWQVTISLNPEVTR